MTVKFNIFVIKFREKCSKQNMKKTFRENVFVCEDFSLNRKESELYRKYKVLGGLWKIYRLLQFQRQNKMDGSIGFSTTQSAGYYLETSFTFQNEFNFFFGTQRKIFAKNMELHEFVKNNNS